jgi:DNA (cytosine-5)-methyltransferase 1
MIDFNNGRDFRLKVERQRTGEPLRLLDLFAGCGGLSLGFHLDGYQVMGGIEWDPRAAETHASNFFSDCSPDNVRDHAIPRDITQTHPRVFMREVLGADSPLNLIDIIVGGPPCQAFARIGRAKLREVLEHPNGFLTDDRANLYTQFLEYVEFFRPLAVLMENVPDIMNYGNQNVAEEIATSLEDMGYTSRYTILNSAHYGIPQMRQRFYLIAFHGELNIHPVFPQPTHYIDLPEGYENAQMVALNNVNLFDLQDVHYSEAPEPTEDLPHAVSASEAIGDLPPITRHLEGRMKRGVRRFDTLACYRDDVTPSRYARRMREWPGFESDEGVWDHVTRYLPRDFQIFARMNPGDQYPEAYTLAETIFEEERGRLEKEQGRSIEPGTEEYKQLKASIVPPYDPGKFPNKWRKLDPNEPSRTLTAHIGKDTYSHIHYDSDQARVISVREAARLQSFPDGFKFSGAMNAAFRQIGNSVPPLQANALARQIRQLLKTALQKDEE